MTSQPSFLNMPNYKYQNEDDSSNFQPTYIHIGTMHLLGELRGVRLYRYYTERDRLRGVHDHELRVRQRARAGYIRESHEYILHGAHGPVVRNHEARPSGKNQGALVVRPHRGSPLAHHDDHLRVRNCAGVVCMRLPELMFPSRPATTNYMFFALRVPATATTPLTSSTVTCTFSIACIVIKNFT